MKIRKILLGLAASYLLMPGITQAAFVLPGSGFITYGDANSYSLPLLQRAQGCVGPGCDYYVASTPGAIKDLVVLGTAPKGQNLNKNFPGMNDAYKTPDGKKGGNFFSTKPINNDPGYSLGDPTTPLKTAWDTELTDLASFLNGGDMVFFFNNNNESSLGAAAQTLAAWAQLWVTKDGAVSSPVFELTNGDTFYGAGGIINGTAGGGSAVDPTTNTPTTTTTTVPGLTGGITDYVLSGGQICLDAGDNIVDCGGGSAVETINHNLGANEAAYAVVFPELDKWIRGLTNLAGYTLHVDFRLGCDPGFGAAASDEICSGATFGFGKNLNNGYEQVFMASTTSDVPNVPEPLTILMLGLGLAGLGFARNRMAS